MTRTHHETFARHVTFLTLDWKRIRVGPWEPKSFRAVCRSVCLSVRKVYCDWIWMPLGVVIGVGRWMGVLDGVEIVEGMGSFGGKCGASHCNQLTGFAA